MITGKPKISVIMSVYNGERYLRSAIESILQQSFSNFEFIIINDGSIDNSLQLIEYYAQLDKRIFVINQENLGLTKSLNNGLSIAKGKYAARQDADDISRFDRLEKQYRFLENNNDYALVGCFRHDVDENEKTIIKSAQPNTDEELRKTIFFSNPFVHGSLMFRYNVLAELGFYREKIKLAQDYDLILRITEKYKVFILPDYLYQLRIIGESISRNKFIEQDKYRDLIIKLSELRTSGKEEDFDFWYNSIVSKRIGSIERYYLLKKKRANWELNYGKNFFFIKDMIMARKYLVRSFFILPSIKTLIFILLTFSPIIYWIYKNKIRA